RSHATSPGVDHAWIKARRNPVLNKDCPSTASSSRPTSTDDPLSTTTAHPRYVVWGRNRPHWAQVLHAAAVWCRAADPQTTCVAGLRRCARTKYPATSARSARQKNCCPVSPQAMTSLLRTNPTKNRTTAYPATPKYSNLPSCNRG